MVVYNFKKIQAVPTASDFIDIVLTRTQRKTPTVVHPQYALSRIRAFYMRKVKYTQQTYNEKLTQILTDFPRLDDIHPFYADLINILYDRDHYKLALGQINTARALIDNVSKDYVKMLKYGDSLYRCKQLKRAALGRMCTIMKKQKSSLAYLEEVRKHLSRLPSIDPNTRTVLVTGFPNVGKSSFMNKVTRAEVDVQPYAFTTKSLYVGHMDYKYLRWQVIDTPGILDHPLEERNTIEMQAVTALAHLQSTILFFIDISEQCGFSIQQQLGLFNTIRPLFANKPLIMVANKIDQVKLEDLEPEMRAAIEKACQSASAKLLPMSNFSEDGINLVKQTACDDLLVHRVSNKVKVKKVDEISNQLTVALPRPRDSKVRQASIPESVLRAREGDSMQTEKRTTEKDIMWENGGPGVYSADFTKHYDLKKKEWRWDVVPEIMDGKNVVDFVDPEIMKKLEELEREEEAGTDEEMSDGDFEDLGEDEKNLVKEIRRRKAIIVQRHRAEKNKNRSTVPRNKLKKSSEQVKEELGKIGFQSESASAVAARGRKRSRSIARDGDSTMEDTMDVEGESRAAGKASKSLTRSRSKSRAPSLAPGKETAFKDDKQRGRAVSVERKNQRKRNKLARIGEADRHEGPKLLKHRLSGKRKQGTTRSR